MKMKKKVLITLSRVFPLTHPKKGKPTLFEDHIKDGTKIHTIRSNYDRWAHNIEKVENGDFYISLRQWSAKPYRSSQNEIAKISQAHYQQIEIHYHKDSDTITAEIEGRSQDISQVAKNDGLSLEDFSNYFFPEKLRDQDRTFYGIVIHFTDFNY